MVSMNQYYKHQIQEFYRSFLERSFDQKDIANFYVMSRDYARKNSVIREIGDFLAHPDKKDRGIVLRSITDVMPLFEAEVEDYRAGIERSFEERPRFKSLESDIIIEDIKLIFDQANIRSGSIDKNDGNFRDFLFCTIFLLSTFAIQYKDQRLNLEAIYSHSLTLQVSCESVKFDRNFVLLPILFLPNVWINCPSTIVPKHHLKRHIARRFKQGFLAAVPYELDKLHREKLISSSSFTKGEIWPLPDY
ncbi:hypothetical protein PSOS111911_15110 [Pseudoalteromonas ostreae]